MDFSQTDLIQLGQMIRIRAYSLHMAMQYINPDRNKTLKDLDELLICLKEWKSRDYPDGPDKKWAEEVIGRFKDWKNNKETTAVPFTTIKGLPDLDIVMKLIKSRRSIRLWQTRKVKKELIKKIIEAGIYAPTAFNRMPWRFFVAEDPDYEKTPDRTNESMMKNAPVKIFVGVDERLFFEKYSGPLDAGLAMQNMGLAAHAAGLGTCLVYQGEFSDRVTLASKYGIPEHINVYCVMLMGYPAEQPDTPVRMNVEEITDFL